jgi:hypothetical protein
MLALTLSEALMNRNFIRFLTTTISAVLLCAASHAAVISMDLNQPGDGLLTYDTINHRQWLDLSQTEGWSQAETKQALLPGGIYQGFHVATVDDVTAFVSSAGYDSTSSADEPNFAIATQLIDLLNQDLWYITAETNVGSTRFDKSLPTGDWALVTRWADAWAASISGIAPFEDFEITTLESGQADVPLDPAPPLSFSFSTVASFAGTPTEFLDTSFTLPARAFWLYRDVPVPEPATATFLIFAIGITALTRRRSSI